MKRILVLLILILMIRLLGFTQPIESPPEGKSIIYFYFDPSLSSGETRLFKEQSFVGSFPAGSYASVVLEPGDELFWTDRNGSSWMEANVAANKRYLVVVESSGQSDAATIRLTPLRDGSPRYWSIWQLLRRQDPLDSSTSRPGSEGDMKTIISSAWSAYRDKKIPVVQISTLAADENVGNSRFAVPPISH
jgi:hypothetical protein